MKLSNKDGCYIKKETEQKLSHVIGDNKNSSNIKVQTPA